ncbi:MAG TPA: phage tail protein, partial [Xanthobacteraceae bacterium]
SFFKWSKTANSNAAADPTINWAEGQAPSTVNDSARAMMAAAAKYRDDVAGAITTGGTATAYTVNSNQAFDSLANMDGRIVAFVPHATSGAGPVTLNVDGLGAKALRSSPGVELAAGTLIAGTPYAATYRNAGNEWLLHGFFGANPYNVPLAAGMPFFGAVAPNSTFAFPRGQAISRTTYAALFALIGTTYGAGDGSTTFALPDLSGRLLACREGMDGAPAPGRITPAGSGIDGTLLGATGGGETVTLAASQMPTHTHANALSDPGHTHPVSGATGGVSNPHQHAFSGTTSGISGQHTHSAPGLASAGGFLGGGGLAAVTGYSGGSATQTGTESADHSHTYSGATGSENADHSHNFSATAGGATTGASVVNAPAGGGLAHNNMPPTMVVNYIMRVL